MLRGAQPFDKTIRQQQLPEDLIPKDDKGPDHQRVKRKKPMTRRRFRPAENEDGKKQILGIEKKTFFILSSYGCLRSDREVALAPSYLIV